MTDQAPTRHESPIVRGLTAVNPLGKLIAAEPPPPARPHTGGRRELRLEAGARGVTIHHRDRSEQAVLRAVAEGRAPQPTGTTLPIQRADQVGKDRSERRQAGVSARQQKKARREALQQAGPNWADLEEGKPR